MGYVGIDKDYVENPCVEKEKINFFYFWFVGIFLFALIYEVNY